eukprot:XP_011662960.1 PREDICTED: uncharacterized protein LOC105437721 [Strongylocentrotus purpuratus]
MTMDVLKVCINTLNVNSEQHNSSRNTTRRSQKNKLSRIPYINLDTMASRFFLICLIALMVVGMTTAFPYELDDDQDAEALMFLKRDPVMQDLLLAEKRGANMKKFKACETAPGCLCFRRGGNVAFCQGQGGADGI